MTGTANRISVELPALGDLSAIAAEKNPSGLAFAEDGGESVTWAEFEERSLVAADAFTDHVRQGDRVAFLSDSSVDTTVLWNGALKAGSVVSYVHTKASPETVAYSIDELRPKVLVVHQEFAQFLADRVWDDLACEPTVVVVGPAERSYEQSTESFLVDATATSPDVLHSEDDIAVIAWTSGTTGRPKGWCHTNRSMVLKGLISGVDQTSVSLTSASTSFMAWYGAVVSTMLAAASVVYLPDWDPARWAEMVEEYEATGSGMVPTMWRAVLNLDLEEYDFSSLEHVGFVGEQMDQATLETLREEICPNVVNQYSSTEVHVSRITAEEMEGDRLESVGRPLDGVRVRIIEPGGAPDDLRPTGESGEVIVKTADCPVWAWGQSEKANETFRDGWWYSGDMGYQDEEGYLYLEGRTDFMIKSKGVKVFPAPIEARLNDHPGVDQAAVVGLDDEEFGQQVTAAVSRTDPEVTPDELDQWCLDADTIARFERPREYHFVDSIPRTPSQKLDRQSVIDRLETDGR